MNKPLVERVLPVVVVNLRDEVQKKFGDRVICLLFYGSHAFKRPRSDKSDYDYYLLLDKPRKGDIKILYKICSGSERSDFSLQYLSVLEMRGWNNFRHGNHGPFFLYHLASSIPLIGTNIFARKVMQFDSKTIEASLVAQIEEYFWRLDHWHINTTKTGSDLLTATKKYLVRICQDMMLAKGDISFQEINESTDSDFTRHFLSHKSYLSKYTVRKIITFIDCTSVKEANKLYPPLRDALYKDFLSEFYDT